MGAKTRSAELSPYPICRISKTILYHIIACGIINTVRNLNCSSYAEFSVVREIRSINQKSERMCTWLIISCENMV